MIHAAKNAPIHQTSQPSDSARKTGKAMTNQTSRAPNRNKRAADSRLMARLLEKMSRNFGLFFALPRSRLSSHRLSIHTMSSAPAIHATAWVNPSTASMAPPRKKPTPFNAFFDPVRAATQRNNAPCWSPGTSSLMALLALILLRSLAMPDSACAHITQAMVSHAAGSASINSATTCSASPIFIVRLSPMRAPSQPPTRLVTTPNSS